MTALVLCSTTCPRTCTCRRSPLVTRPQHLQSWDNFKPYPGGCDYYLPDETLTKETAMAVETARME